MPSRQFPPAPPISTPRVPIFRTKSFFLAITLSSTVLILLTLCYVLFHFYNSFINPSKTIPFDSSTLLKLYKFSYKELKNATNCFSPSNLIGKGGSGTVYRGVLRNGKSVAVKKLDASSLQAEREFQNELQILGGIRSRYIVTLLGYCIFKKNRILVYEYMPNKALQERLFDIDHHHLDWEKRFAIIEDVCRGIEFLHFECDPPVIHGDIKPSNVLLDKDYRAKVSDFGLSRVKVEEGGEFGGEMFSQELSGTLAMETPVTDTPVESVNEVDFALALQASTSSKNSRSSYCKNVGGGGFNLPNFGFFRNNVNNGSSNNDCKGKEVSSVVDIGGDDWNKFIPYDDELCSSMDHSKDLKLNVSHSFSDHAAEEKMQWGKDWWWKQDGSGELCSKDYVTEWIGSQICPSENPDPKRLKLGGNSARGDEFDHVNEMQPPGSGVGDKMGGMEKKQFKGWTKGQKRRPRKMQEWWREEHLEEISKKGSGKGKKPESKWRKGFKMPRINMKFQFKKRKSSGQSKQMHNGSNGEFSFRRGWKTNAHSGGSEMWSGDLFSRELSSTTSMRGTLCYVAPEYTGCGYLMEKSDIYSLGVLILVIVSGRRPLHVLSSPMKLEKANLVSWCRHLAQTGNITDLVDEKLKDQYNKEQACLCIYLALACLQKLPELRPDIEEIIKILKGEMDLPQVPYEFSPSPPSKLLGKSKRKPKANNAD